PRPPAPTPGPGAPLSHPRGLFGAGPGPSHRCGRRPLRPVFMGVHCAAQKELKEWRQTIAPSTNEKLRMVQALGRVLLDTTIDDAAVRAVSFARVPEAALREAVADTAGLIRPRHDGAIDFFGTRYSPIRQFAPAFLQTRAIRSP